MGNFKKIAFICLGLAMSSSVYAGDQPVSVYNEPKGGGSYKLSERLATDGSSLLTLPQVYTKAGVWTEDRFIFPGAPADSEVLISQDKVKDKLTGVIQLQLRAGFTNTLEFSQIQAKPRLVLQFKAPPSDPSSSAVSSIYVRVYIGKRLIDRLRLSTDTEWVRKEYALSSAQFLKQKLTLRLSMNCDSDESMLMLFGYLKN